MSYKVEMTRLKLFKVKILFLEKDHYFLAPIGMETKNVPMVSGHFFVVRYSGKDVYGNAQTIRF